MCRSLFFIAVAFFCVCCIPQNLIIYSFDTYVFLQNNCSWNLCDRWNLSISMNLRIKSKSLKSLIFWPTKVGFVQNTEPKNLFHVYFFCKRR